MTAALAASLVLIGLLLAPGLAGAEESAPAPAEAAKAAQTPIEITADGGIEWNRAAKTYVARGAAQARRGDLSIAADTLTAHYRDGPDGGSEIYQLEATGHVRLASQSAVVTGGRAVYDVATRKMTVTGEGLKLETPTDVLTAQDRLEYSDRTREASAHGAVTVVRDEQRLEAEHVLATLAPGSAGELAVHLAEVVRSGDNVWTDCSPDGDTVLYLRWWSDPSHPRLFEPGSVLSGGDA